MVFVGGGRGEEVGEADEDEGEEEGVYEVVGWRRARGSVMRWRGAKRERGGLLRGTLSTSA